MLWMPYLLALVPRRGDSNKLDADSIEGLDFPWAVGKRVNVESVGVAALLSGEPDRSVSAHT